MSDKAEEAGASVQQVREIKEDARNRIRRIKASAKKEIQQVKMEAYAALKPAKAARKLAGKDPMSKEPYRIGDPAVVKDMSEENDAHEPDFILDPADTYEVTEPPAEPPTEPPADTIPSDTHAPDSESVPSPDGTREPSAKRGCASAVSSLSLLPLLSPLPLWLKKRNNPTHKGEIHET